jgi:gamma-glutamylcyclotransferase (GGCT)/AIG2-like uncharacterized protein YtfP
MNLFTYGTLMFPEVWQRIGIAAGESEPATLQGYAAYRLCDTVIPGIIEAGDDDITTGVLYHGLDEETLFELDAYESDLYQRSAVQVMTSEGISTESQSYIIPQKRRQALSDERWDAERFKQVELVKYLAG